MAAVFDWAIDKACFASPEAAEADAAVALLAAAALLDDLAMSICSLLTCCCRSSICVSKGLRSVQPAAITRTAKINPLVIISCITPSRHPTMQGEISHNRRRVTPWTNPVLSRRLYILRTTVTSHRHLSPIKPAARNATRPACALYV